jgi:hypothetical protein
VGLPSPTPVQTAFPTEAPTEAPTAAPTEAPTIAPQTPEPSPTPVGANAGSDANAEDDADAEAGTYAEGNRDADDYSVTGRPHARATVLGAPASNAAGCNRSSDWRIATPEAAFFLTNACVP